MNNFELSEEGIYEFDISLEKKCIYEVGVMVIGGSDYINNNIGKPSAGFVFPGELSIDVKDESGLSVFEMEKFSGKPYAYRYSGERVALIAGNKVLESGRYSIRLVLKERFNLAGLSLFFWLEKMPKVEC